MTPVGGDTIIVSAKLRKYGFVDAIGTFIADDFLTTLN
jgi:hypothetical protein